MTPPNEGKLFRIWTAIAFNVALSWYPVPDAVLELGAPTKTLTFGFGLIVRAHASQRPKSQF
jgi:hypothetical protein